MRQRAPVAIASALAVFAFGLPGPARAQNVGVRWDVGAEVGALQRFRSSAPTGAPRPDLGPSAEIHAHAAIFPMVRVGAYVAYDASPAAGRSVREFVGAGLRIKVTPPLFRRPWRAWAFAGLGGAWAIEPGFRVATPGAATSPEESNAIAGGEGGILEVPFGLGLGWMARSPWRVFAELGGRATLVEGGALYEAPFCLCREAFAGKDSFAVGLSVGVSWEQ